MPLLQIRSLALAVLLLPLALASRAEEPMDPVLAQMGEPYFRSYCATCHGLSGRGDGPTAMALRTPPADLTGIARRRGGVFPSGEIAKKIDGRFELGAHGSREMPVWGSKLASDVPEAGLADSIARGKILVIVEYLRSIQAAGDEAEDAD